MRFLDSSDKSAALDYRSALDSAVAWLGDRYLLARPVKRLAPVERYRTSPAAAATVLRKPRSAAN